jgi:hypothetical protein
VADLNANLVQARQNYKDALDAQRMAFEFKGKVDGNPDAKPVIDNADFQVELATMRFRQALRDFVIALQRNSK